MNVLPINGRVAIVDDVLEQAQPLMQELSKRQIPFVYYDGEPENFSEKEDRYNDIRILFLDLNLMGNAEYPTKQLYSAIYATMDRIISENNFPYILICWTRTNEQYEEIIGKIKEDFQDRTPIDIVSLPKAEYFGLDGSKTERYEEKMKVLFEKIEEIIEKHAAFKNLISWENHIHNATNSSLTESLSVIKEDWDNSANWIFTKWAKAFSGCNFDDYNNSERLKSAYHTLNHFLLEKIEEEIENNVAAGAEFIEENNEENKISMSKFNEKLLFSFVNTKPKEPGRIIHIESGNCFSEILSFAIKNNAAVITQIEQKKQFFKLVVNPLCDFAQNKVKRNRIIPGVFIEKKYRQKISNNSDALYISPPFFYNEKKTDYFFILDFRFFTSEENYEKNDEDHPVKLKQQVLSEILSKLSRHINRQGILSIDE